MNPTLQGEVTLSFTRGGISSKNNKPYLSVSNGKKEFFVNFKKGHGVTPETFERFEEDDEITLEVIVKAGSEEVTFVRVVD